VRLPREAYPLDAAIATHLPHLTAAQRRGLAWWVYGALLAGSACQAAVALALGPVVGPAAAPALRQRLREWCYAGADKAAPCRAEVEVAACFAPLLGWVLAWWRGDALALALDATYLRDRLVVVSVSVLYRGTAIPVAWHVAAANRRGAWLGPALGLLWRLAPAVPAGVPVLVLADRGLWSGQLWDGLRRLGLRPCCGSAPTPPSARAAARGCGRPRWYRGRGTPGWGRGRPTSTARPGAPRRWSRSGRRGRPSRGWS
jgi:hypothetical protein